jgi:WS/DGAT/MGAT family acyltransferase
MKQLGALDSLFLYNERRNAPMHISPLIFYDVRTAKGGFVRFKDILATFRSRLAYSPVFRRKLVRVPLDLDYPWWVEDKDFDLEFHVRHMALPKPGDWRQFCILIARLHSRALDLSRPPWEAYIIEGLDNIPGLPPGSFALYMKIHHCAIDGATGNQIVEALHDLDSGPPSPRADTWAGEPDPRPGFLLRKALVTLSRQPRAIYGFARHSWSARKRVRAGFAGKDFPEHQVKERILFNGTITPHRVFGGVPFEIDRFKAIKNAAGSCTLNDVVMAVVAGAMRRYLGQREDLPQRPLVAAVPINVRPPDEKSEGGNLVSIMRIGLSTDVADPLERLRRINEDAVSSKAYQNAIGAERIADLSQSLPASVAALGMRAALAAGLASRAPMVHTVITNVPGPQVPLYMCGARAVWWYGAGCPADGLGLFHTITSYYGTIAIAYIACRSMLPDPEFYDACIRGAVEELEQALGLQRVTPPAPARRRKRRSAAGGP